MELQINKVKYDKKLGLVTIEYDQIGDDEVKITLKSTDAPLDELVDCFYNLIPYVETICQLPDGYCNDSEIRGVSLSWTNGIMGVVVTCLIPLDNANSPMVINTPHVPSEQYSEGGQSPVLSKDVVTVIKTLIEEATRYINGERKPDVQLKLDLK
jgi:hypothetical protein